MKSEGVNPRHGCEGAERPINGWAHRQSIQHDAREPALAPHSHGIGYAGVAADYPICLHLHQRRCVVVGGGEVALRKVNGLQAAGASVTVVSPDLVADLVQLRDEGRIAHEARRFRPDDLDSAFLAVAATDDAQTNQLVVFEARERRVLVNSVTGPVAGDFSLPAVLRRGDLTVAVSTSGRSPALARYLREELESLFTPEYVLLLEVTAAVRAELRARGCHVRAEAWRLALDDELLALVRAGNLTAAHKRLSERLVGASERVVHQNHGSKEIVLVGLNHKTAPVSLRERLALKQDGLAAELSALRQRAAEGVILSTCNRVEVYAVASGGDDGCRAIAQFLAEQHEIAEADLTSHLYSKHGEAAVRHAFTVAAGLDSMIIGEPQILGQMRGAYELAATEGTAGPLLTWVFHHALKVGKQARSDTGICRSAVSVSYAAVQLAREILGALSCCRGLVIGAGEMSELAARALVANGLGELVVTNRTLARATEVAERCGGQAADFSHLTSLVAAADLVISSTGAPDFILPPHLVAESMRVRPSRPLVLIDIAVPRDVDPAVARLPNVHLHDIDALQGVCLANLEQRRKETASIGVMIEDEIEAYRAWWGRLNLVPTISALRRRAEEIRLGELSKASGKLSELSEREREAVNCLTLSIINKLIHKPISQLRRQGVNGDARHYARSLRELFALEGEFLDP